MHSWLTIKKVNIFIIYNTIIIAGCHKTMEAKERSTGVHTPDCIWFFKGLESWKRRWYGFVFIPCYNNDLYSIIARQKIFKSDRLILPFIAFKKPHIFASIPLIVYGQIMILQNEILFSGFNIFLWVDLTLLLPC